MLLVGIYEPFGTKTERMSFDQRQKIVCERFVLEEIFPDSARMHRGKKKHWILYKNFSNQKVGVSVRQSLTSNKTTTNQLHISIGQIENDK